MFIELTETDECITLVNTDHIVRIVWVDDHTEVCLTGATYEYVTQQGIYPTANYFIKVKETLKEIQDLMKPTYGYPFRDNY